MKNLPILIFSILILTSHYTFCLGKPLEAEIEEYEVVVQNTHSMEITSVAFTLDSRFILSSSSDKTVKLWSLDGKLIRTFSGHKNRVYGIDVSSDNQHFLSYALDNTIKIWKLDGGLKQTIFAHSVNIVKALFLGEGQQIISAGNSDSTSAGLTGEIKVWTTGGELVESIQLEEDIIHFALSPDEKHVIITHLSGKMTCINLEDGRRIEITDEDYYVGGIHFLPDSERIIWIYFDSMYNKNQIKLSFLTGENEGQRFIITPSEPDYFLALSADGNYIACPYFDNTIKIWDINEKKLVRIIQTNSFVTCLAFSPDSAYLAAGGVSGIELYSIYGQRITCIENKSPGVFDLSLSPDGRWLAYSASDGSIKLWNKQDGFVKDISDISNRYFYIDFFPDGSQLACGLDDGIKVLDLSGNEIEFYNVGNRDFSIVRFTEDGRYLAGVVPAGLLMLLDWNVGTYLEYFVGYNGDIHSFVISSDSQLVVTGHEGGMISVFNLILGQMVNEFKAHSFYVNSLALSPDNQSLLSGGVEFQDYESELKLWDLNGKLIHNFDGETVTSIAFNPDGTILACGSSDSIIRLWNKEGELIAMLEGHTADITCLAFSPDSRFLYSGSLDSTIRIWNLDTLESIGLTAHGDEWIVFTRDGYYFSSERGGDLAGITKGWKRYTLDQFFLRNNRPDIVLDRIGLLSETQKGILYIQYLESLANYGFTEEKLFDEYHAPEISILETKHGAGILTVTVRASAYKYNLLSYQVLVNGAPLYGECGREITGRLKIITETAVLKEGDNLIELFCFNEKGARSVIKRIISTNPQ
jgi:WD40 repeat protein